MHRMRAKIMARSGAYYDWVNVRASVRGQLYGAWRSNSVDFSKEGK